LDRSARAQELGSYAAEFRAAYPEVFAGAWLSEDGEPIVAVTTTEAARIAAADGYATHLAPVSAATLEQTLAEANAWIASLPKDISDQINSASIDLLNNKVVLDVVYSPIGKALNLPTLLANVQVILTPGQGGPAEAGPVGGDMYLTTAGPIEQASSLAEVGVCSFGFAATAADGSPVNISAGHCNPAPASASPVYLPNYGDVRQSEQVGSFAASYVGSEGAGLDYSLISLNAKGVEAGLTRPVVRGPGGSPLRITGVAKPVVGAPICKSGQNSSFTCGIVAADRVETQLFLGDGTSRLVTGFAGTACTLAGDSGGAIVTGTLALGITSGSNTSTAPNCGAVNVVLAASGGATNLGVPIASVLAANPGLTIATAE
jgi:hypothetical protein